MLFDNGLHCHGSNAKQLCLDSWRDCCESYNHSLWDPLSSFGSSKFLLLLMFNVDSSVC